MTHGDAALCRGSVAVAGVNLQEGAGIKTVFRNAQLGYCAQHDALFDELSVAEHLDLFGQIRGLVRASREQASRNLFAFYSLATIFCSEILFRFRDWLRSTDWALSLT